MKLCAVSLLAVGLSRSARAFSPAFRPAAAALSTSSSAFRPSFSSLFAASANAAASSTFQLFPSIDVTSTTSTAPFSLNSILPLDTPTVVIFLRHMGWPYCWSYASDWKAVTDQQGNEVKPKFVSIGTQEQLKLFLDLNPDMPPSHTFSVPIDDFVLSYGAVGLGSMSDGKAPSLSTVARMKAPSGINPISYAMNVIKLSPVDAGNIKFGEVPEGVMRLGGTFVLRRTGKDVVETLYRHEDQIPGDHPEIGEVLKSL